MGNLFGRHKETTLEVLEHIEKDVNKLEEYRKHTELKQKHIIGSLVFYALLVYIGGVISGYFYYGPTDITEWTLFALPIFAFPSIVWMLKTLLSFWFARRLETNDASLVELRDKRKKILEEVKETETFKVATEILEKYDPATKREKAVKEQVKENRKDEEMMRRLSPQRLGGGGGGGFSNQNQPQQQQQQQQLRRRNGKSSVAPSDPKPTDNTNRSMPRNNGMTPQRPGPNSPTGMVGSPGMMGPPSPRTPLLPRPILPQERGTVDKFVDYLLGDGPNNRYALVCSHCRSHNGMCLKEEFEYMSFRCAYCFFFNPARSQRPHAPRLNQGTINNNKTRSELATSASSLPTTSTAQSLPSLSSASQPTLSSSDNIGLLRRESGETDPLLDESDERNSRDDSSADDRKT